MVLYLPSFKKTPREIKAMKDLRFYLDDVVLRAERIRVSLVWKGTLYNAEFPKPISDPDLRVQTEQNYMAHAIKIKVKSHISMKVLLFTLK